MSFSHQKAFAIRDLIHLKETNSWIADTAEIDFGSTKLIFVNTPEVIDCLIARLRSMKGPYVNNQPCAQTEAGESRFYPKERFAKRYRIHPGSPGKPPIVNPPLR